MFLAINEVLGGQIGDIRVVMFRTLPQKDTVLLVQNPDASDQIAIVNRVVPIVPPNGRSSQYIIWCLVHTDEQISTINLPHADIL
jgi:hypothetical protein